MQLGRVSTLLEQRPRKWGVSASESSRGANTNGDGAGEGTRGSITDNSRAIAADNGSPTPLRNVSALVAQTILQKLTQGAQSAMRATFTSGLLPKTVRLM